MTTDSELISQTQAERERLAALFRGLSPEQWAAPSLCAGWGVGDVAAHMTMPFRTRPTAFITGLIGPGSRSTGSPTRMPARPRAG